MTKEEAANKRVCSITEPPKNDYSGHREVTIYKHRRFELIEVEKEKIDNIQKALDNKNKASNNGAGFSDVFLGLSTTFLGCFLGFIPNILDMLRENKLTWHILVYVFSLFLAVILFVVYLNRRRKKCADSAALIEVISQNIGSISESLVIPDNNIPNSHISNNLDGLSKKPRQMSASGGNYDEFQEF